MIRRILCVCIISILLIIAETPENDFKKTNEKTYGGSFTLSNISNWSCWIFDNGLSAHSPDGNSGAIYPRGTAGTIYQDGFLWGGKVNLTDSTEQIRVGGQTYNCGTIPGWVIAGGNYEDDNFILADRSDPAVRVYRIRSDCYSLSHNNVIQDAAEHYRVEVSSVTEAMTLELINQYILDWEEWPVEHGAPYKDVDGDGMYTAGVDEPGYASADQVIWLAINDYNNTATISLFGSEPLGLECQITIWAYNQPGHRLGQSIYKSYKVINKSNKTIKDMYFAQWSDPDVGSASNDFVGCDTLLDLAYAYNGDVTDDNFSPFDLAPPAIGYALLQGPMVESPGDTAYLNFQPKLGYKNLEMTSFGWFAVGSSIDPNIGEYIQTLQYYNFMRGYKPTEDINNPLPWTLGNIESAKETKYPLHGDPTIAGATEVDGTDGYFRSGDRRICLSSGPFNFAPGDTQEVMVALVGGVGEDNIRSIEDMKLNAGLCKTLYNHQLETIPQGPIAPRLILRPFETSLVLEWGSDHDRVEEIEGYKVNGYEFEGYNIYQIPDGTSNKEEAVRIATFDIINDVKVINDTRYLDEFEGHPAEVPVAYGDDIGIQRYIKIDRDYINGGLLHEGKTYYFAVTAYNKNLSEDRIGSKIYESSFIPMAVTLQEELPGNALRSYTGQSDFEIMHTGGYGEGNILIKVVDPYAITGDDYSIHFDYNDDSSDVVFAIWNETNGLKLSDDNQLIQDTLNYSGATIVDGLEIKVVTPEEGLRTVAEYDADYNLIDEKVSICNMSLGSTGYLFTNPAFECNLEPYAQDFDRYGVRRSDDIEIDFTDSSVAWQFSNDECLSKKVPFAMYRWSLGREEKERLFIVIHDEGWGDTSVTDGLGSWDITGVDNAWGVPCYEPIYAYRGPSPYDPSKEADYIAANDIKEAPSSTGMGIYSYTGNPGYPVFTSGIIMDYLGYGYPVGNKIIFETYKSFYVDDEFRFSTAGYEPIQSDSLLQSAIDRINVFPNPYYGFDKVIVRNFIERVTFTHLPERATIKIFNLAGVLVKTIEHHNANSQFESWYLENESGIRAGNGMYIAHISMPDIGREKILKFMIVRSGEK